MSVIRCRWPFTTALTAAFDCNGESAARLLGYTQGLMPGRLYEDDLQRAFLQNATARAAAEMGPERFEQLFAIGRWMDEDTLVTIAFEV
jgi:hypothetical protein